MKQQFDETDLVNAIGEYMHAPAFSDESELKNDTLTEVAEGLKQHIPPFEPQTRVGKFAWQLVNNDPGVSEEWDEAFEVLAEIFQIEY